MNGFFHDKTTHRADVVGGFWILDFGFWIGSLLIRLKKMNRPRPLRSAKLFLNDILRWTNAIQNPKSKIQNLILLLMIPAGTATAQQAEQLVRGHRYTEAIDAVMAGRDGLDGLADADLSVLGVAHLQRAYLLRDLAALQAAIGRRYYHLRLTSDDIAPTPWTAYFLGRHLLAQGLPDQALPHFEASFDAARLPGEYRRRARIWAAACHALQGRTGQANTAWDALAVRGKPALAGERAYARSVAGQDETPACGDAAPASAAAFRCLLWAGLQTKDAATVRAVQQRLLREDLPDQETRISDDFVLRFYDPATLDMLALADFATAMEAFSRFQGTRGRRDALLYAGISAYEAGDDERARAFLDQTDHPLRVVYLGALAYRAGDRATAAQHWAQARSGAPSTAIEWASVAARFETEHDAVGAVAARHRDAATGNQRASRMLGRALLEIGQPDEALRLLETAYPAQFNHDLSRIEPGYLITLTRAQFAAGRRYYPAVRSHLASLIDAYPAVASVLYLAQAYTAPERTMGKKRTG